MEAKSLPVDACAFCKRGRDDHSESPPSSPDLTSQEGSFCLPLEECLKRPKAVFIPPHLKQENDLRSESEDTEPQPSQFQPSSPHSQPSQFEPPQLELPSQLQIPCCQRQRSPVPTKRKRGRPKGYPKTGGRKKGTKNKPKNDMAKAKDRNVSG